MHCPICGQKQISEETRFCSRCGFLLTGVATVVASGGLVPTSGRGLTGSVDSPKRRGVKKGIFWFLLGFLVVPIMALITLALEIPPFLPVLAVLLFGVGGLLRIAYAMLFESGVAAGSGTMPINILREAEHRNALPSSQSIPASAYTSPAPGKWRDTNELQREPGSVIDGTTKLLDHDDQ